MTAPTISDNLTAKIMKMDFLDSPPKRKTALIIAGANGSGKTTFAKALLRKRRFDLPFLNPDEIAKEVLSDRPESVAMRAGKLYINRRNDLLNRNHSLAIETTFCGNNMQRFVQSVKAKGYKVFIVYAFVDNPDLCIARIRIRVEGGGHYIPDDLVRRRFSISHRNFWGDYRLAADEWAIVYNGGKPPALVAVGQGFNYTVKDNALFALFKDNIK